MWAIAKKEKRLGVLLAEARKTQEEVSEQSAATTSETWCSARAHLEILEHLVLSNPASPLLAALRRTGFFGDRQRVHCN